ncbi:MAG TPA: hypothetical protein VKY74_28475 [Chloroflexia bacterium]|nr:hypothetical protein [Chloroflexia bacterium]
MKAAPSAPGWGQVPYRVRQFVLALAAPVTPDELADAVRAAGLPAPAAQLFRAMPRPYQRHALNVADRLRREGHTDPHLLQAALLHDLGKWDPASGRRAGVVPRVLATLLGRRPGGRALLARLAAGPPAARSWRYGWHLQQAHPELGARLAERAGVDPAVVALVRYHQDARGGPAHLAALLRRLQHADDQE